MAAHRRDDDDACVADLVFALVIDPRVGVLGLAIVLTIVWVLALRRDDDDPRNSALVFVCVLALRVLDLRSYKDDDRARVAALSLVLGPSADVLGLATVLTVVLILALHVINIVLMSPRMGMWRRRDVQACAKALIMLCFPPPCGVKERRIIK